jgi:hypothetical protein
MASSKTQAQPEQHADTPKVPNGYCPNHATGVTLPDDVAVTPLQYVDELTSPGGASRLTPRRRPANRS